jgi:radical SAM superfamily enzyme YgiQ (UPF0313 family)
VEVRILFQLSPYNQQRQFQKLVWIFPIKLAMYATALRNQGNEVIWDGIDDGSFDKIIKSELQIDIPFLQLPHANRILTKAFDKKWQSNGNFKFHPGVYIQSSNTCWYKKCYFCKETIENQNYELRSVEDVINELKYCKELKAKEAFDDSATFPMGTWLDDFCTRIKRIGITFSCNMRIQKGIDFLQLANSGFRMLLFGIESANQATLDKINKGVKVEDIIPTIKKASEAGLEPHICVIFGHPNETDEDAIRTLKLVHYLLRKGYANTAQASYYTVQGIKGNEVQRKYVKQIYDVAYSPEFWFNQLKDIRNIDDIKYLWLKIKKGIQR